MGSGGYSVRQSGMSFSKLSLDGLTGLAVLGASLVAVLFCGLNRNASAQSEGEQAAQRLQSSTKNSYRDGQAVSDLQAVKKNMEELFKPILISGQGDGKADDWYEPHLRDSLIDAENRRLEAVEVRGQVAPVANVFNVCLWYTWNNISPPENYTACPFGNCGQRHVWHGEPYSPHRPFEACFTKAPTTRYKTLIEDSNFKLCCVRNEDKNKTSEQIASRYPMGDGWAGLFEYYFPTTALGWENDRGTTMIVDQAKVRECKEKSDPLMEGAEAQKWVAGAIGRNLKAANGGMDAGDVAEIQKTVSEVIRDVRPEDKNLRFTDSLQSEGLTVRVNFAAMDKAHKLKVTQRFCMHPRQIDKLMVPGPLSDLLQHPAGGGSTIEELDKMIPVWANYCPEAVELMMDPQKSNMLVNVDGTPTKLNVGTQKWEQDPLYCQRMNLNNPNMNLTGFGEVIRMSPGNPETEESVGYTCLSGRKLNGGMAPVTLVRHAAVERRTAIADHAIGFLIAGALAPKMIVGKQSYYKRFEPQRYSMQVPFQYRTFIGNPFKGGGQNELGAACPSVNATLPPDSNKSDRLYISNKTHEPFTQKKIDEANSIDKYVQEWADQKKEDIAKRGFDDKANNYAAAFRIFATCPAGYTRWEPPDDEHNEYLIQNMRNFCRSENFGGVP
jgi:hypothetical protein